MITPVTIPSGFRPFAVHWRNAAAGTLCLAMAAVPSLAAADDRERALQIHNRVAGVPPTEAVLLQMADNIADGNVAAAVNTAMESESFYSVTLKNLATPWTNRDQDVFAALNDYTATFIGLVRDGADIRTLLYGDVLYVSNAAGLPSYSIQNNDHYIDLEADGHSLQSTLVPQAQTSLTGLPAQAVSGVLTSRAGARAFFYAGTNRAMFRFTLLNHLCRDLEQVHDTSLSPDRIRQDVSRSPGGDSRVFLNNCVGCHNGMDPMAQAFAYYNWEYDRDTDPEGHDGYITYNTSGVVDSKHHINSTTFRPGFVIPDDRWDNYWRKGQNSVLGWDTTLPGGGNGAKSMAQELAHSEAFASCQVEKVFRKVCLRRPENSSDHGLINSVTATFMGGNHGYELAGSASYNLKQVFIDTADYCTDPATNAE